MLVFGRKSRQAVVISGSNGGLKPLLTVTVLEVRGGHVKLGFEADDEVWERIRAERHPAERQQNLERPTTQTPTID
jgi:sRNA-binding carbon storage regulator CsrA